VLNSITKRTRKIKRIVDFLPKSQVIYPSGNLFISPRGGNSFDTSKSKVLDLFAGAGGFSEGFIRAGCEMVAHVEMDKNACSTLITRMIYHALRKRGKLDEYKQYILGKITREELIEKYQLHKERDSVICETIGKENYKLIINKIKKILDGDNLDIIIGGPPCQAYSYIGRARDKNRMENDNRNFLYKYYIEFLKAFKPKIFIFENVPGLVTAGEGKYLRDMRVLMQRVGYKTSYKILNTADFGVPQNRKRVILIGWNKNSKLKNYPDFLDVKRNYKVKDFFLDLPKIRAGSGKILKKDFSKKNVILQNTTLAIKDFDILMDHYARPHSSQDLQIYKLAVKAKKKGINIKYNQLPKNLKTHKNEKGFLDRFKVVDISANSSHTIVAHIAKDGHFYIHPSQTQNRSLSVREAARLQTFPDSYKFEGSRGPQFKQIGNAVPPVFAYHLASLLVKYI
jgi:DNA (cytosine-5)-methyltransferase 1